METLLERFVATELMPVRYDAAHSVCVLQIRRIPLKQNTCRTANMKHRTVLNQILKICRFPKEGKYIYHVF